MSRESNFRSFIEWEVEEVVYDFDPGGYLSDEKRTEYTDRILDSLGWEGLMYLLDRHYPVDVFSTENPLPDVTHSTRDHGPIIVSLMRQLDTARSTTAPAAEAGAEGGTNRSWRNV